MCIRIFGHPSPDDSRGLWSEFLLFPAHHLLLDVHLSASRWLRYAPICCHLALSLEPESQVLFQRVIIRREEEGPGGRQQWFNPDPLQKTDLSLTVFMQSLLLLLQLLRMLCRSCPVLERAWERKPLPSKLF